MTITDDTWERATVSGSRSTEMTPRAYQWCRSFAGKWLFFPHPFQWSRFSMIREWTTPAFKSIIVCENGTNTFEWRHYADEEMFTMSSVINQGTKITEGN
ncbi:hypothetical protein Q1695_012214 [Nippostrongylus brasiliensis]|nr:hypothetical protein Q1695_012214 [Nippostrongylus brasiliensis]